MLLKVNHVTRYAYDQPVRAAVQSHRLTPSVFDGQKVLSWTVSVSDGQKGGGFRDGAGDWVQSWSILGPVSEILVRVEGEVETRDLAGVLRGHKEVIAPECYLADTMLTEVDKALIGLTEGLRDASDALACAHELSRRVSDAIAYVPGVTDTDTTASEAMAKGEGVCQDQSHALLAVARHLDMPARYVSGYLQATLGGESHDAAHAWAEIWIAGLGWVGFDPANRCCPDEKYIRLGSGLDSRDAAPIRGISRGFGRETLDVTVRVQVQQ